jgi:hypothetical protein
MSSRSNPTAAAAGVAYPARRRWGDSLEREGSLGPILMFPALAILMMFIA